MAVSSLPIYIAGRPVVGPSNTLYINCESLAFLASNEYIDRFLMTQSQGSIRSQPMEDG